MLLSLLSLSVVAMVAAGFTEEGEEEASTAVEEDFMEAGLGAEDFMAGADSAAEGSEVVGFTAAVVSTAEVDFVAAARFAAGQGFAEELSAAGSVEAFAAMASGAVSADAVGVGEAGAAGAGA